ncbi:lipopolysaccharide biosynthesis protein [Oharaeibacter diazotrophicus]|uniref:O-antigen/teichoic acid export membrane protein n=1 Tax=Oharaeibacter diazotrophicus TaxID=1920512 RepID=A0A4R6RKI9_9HYPH|nr:lipopolysaccharide biosynthesis protein [Oharaeibacter diazotrophicus]TDP86962.1 O-antigen/teichoic acid export membrane protein [Oharaeibacter diazotrophicus]BBE71095.1 hypothetical protein OHA_1_00665 [Pleomorphomonas sp. SM30]GLS77847.1 hypothetical protein GCM10007904_31840 [Oharaeibacter diazotrophicus]
MTAIDPIRHTQSGVVRALYGRVRSAIVPLASVLLKVVAAGTMAVVFVLASRTMTPHDFGRLSVWFNALSFVAVFAALSQDGLIVRLWFEYLARGDHGLARGAVRNGWIVSIAGALVAAAGIGIGLEILGGADGDTATAGAAFVFASAIGLYAASLTRNVRDVLVSGTIQELPWRFLLLAVSGWCLVAGEAMTPALFFWTGAAGFAASILGQRLALDRRYPAAVRKAAPAREGRRWAALTGRLLLPTLMEATSQYAEVILIGLVLDPVTAGGFFAVQRIASVFPMLSTGLLSYTFVRTPKFYFDGETDKLQAMFSQAVRLLLLFVLATLAVVAVAGPFLLGLFGPEYRDEYGTLVLLGLSYAVIACGGTAGMNLLFTGHELAYVRIQAVYLVARIALVLLLASLYGSFGAALAFLAVSAPYTLLLVVANRRRLGADPSVMSLFRRHG